MVPSETSPAIGEWRQNWPIVLSAGLGMSMSVIHVYALGAFYGPIEQDFGWSRAQIASAYVVMTVIGAILHPFIGRAIDRAGTRLVAIPGLLIYAVGMASISFATPSLTTWWLLWAVVGFGATFVQATVWVTAVTAAFSKSRGLALAISLSGMALTSSLAPVIATFLISRLGWNGAFAALPAIWGAFTLPAVFLLFRSHKSKSASQNAPSDEPVLLELGGLSIREGFRSLPFLKLLLVAVISTLVIPNTVMNLIPIVTLKGFTREEAAGMAALIGMASIVGRLISGVLLDRFDARLIGAFSLLAPALTMLILLSGYDSAPVLMIAILILGFALGAEIDVVIFLLSRYVGQKNFGFFMATVTTLWTISTGTGPMLASAVYDKTGSYDWFLMFCIPGAIMASLLIATIGPTPQFQTREQVA